MSKLRDLLRKDRELILSIFDYRCVKCGRPSSTIHEIIPISHGASSISIKNRVPLCVECHNWAHGIGTRNTIPVLEDKRREFLFRKYSLGAK